MNATFNVIYGTNINLRNKESPQLRNCTDCA